MKKNLTLAALALAFTLPAAAQDWSVGVATGPFVFGDFVERTVRPTTGQGTGEPITLTLSAATRAGLAVNVERSLAERWAVRVEGTFTRAPLSVKQIGDESGVEFDSGEMDVTTLVVPLIFRINPHGRLRFHLAGGPAYAMYKTRAPAGSSTISPSDRTSNEWGIGFGGGVAWWMSDRFAVEGNLSDTVTTSPFSEFDDPDTPGVTVRKPHNVHTTIGVRWRF